MEFNCRKTFPSIEQKWKKKNNRLFYRIFLSADGFSLIHMFYFQLGYGILSPLYFRWQNILLTLGVYSEGLYPCLQTTVLLNSIFVQSLSMFKITNQLLQPNLMILKLKKKKNLAWYVFN